MNNGEELSPKNRKIICDRIGEELGIDGSELCQKLANETIEGLYEWRDKLIEWRNESIAKAERYTPRSGMDGMHPEINEVKSNAELFSEALGIF